MDDNLKTRVLKRAALSSTITSLAGSLKIKSEKKKQKKSK
jgi:hypothetical protein